MTSLFTFKEWFPPVPDTRWFPKDWCMDRRGRCWLMNPYTGFTFRVDIPGYSRRRLRVEAKRLLALALDFNFQVCFHYERINGSWKRCATGIETLPDGTARYVRMEQ